MRYLAQSDLWKTLSRGASIEQLLAAKIESNLKIIRFIRIDKERDDCFAVTYFEVIDEGSADFLDIYEFTALDPDLMHGLSVSFEDIDSALNYASSSYDADPDRYVNDGVIQDEYRESRMI